MMMPMTQRIRSQISKLTLTTYLRVWRIAARSFLKALTCTVHELGIISRLQSITITTIDAIKVIGATSQMVGPERLMKITMMMMKTSLIEVEIHFH